MLSEEVKKPQRPTRVRRHAFVVIPLTQGQSTIVDLSDSWIAGRNWFARKSTNGYYAARTMRHRPISLHQELLGFPNCIVDHIDGDTLNNRRSNLRLCDHTGNARNVAKQAHRKYKGTCPSGTRWQARISVGGKLLYLGVFDNEEAAARAYDCAAKQYFGEFARLNFPVSE